MAKRRVRRQRSTWASSKPVDQQYDWMALYHDLVGLRQDGPRWLWSTQMCGRCGEEVMLRHLEGHMAQHRIENDTIAAASVAAMNKAGRRPPARPSATVAIEQQRRGRPVRGAPPAKPADPVPKAKTGQNGWERVRPVKQTPTPAAPPDGDTSEATVTPLDRGRNGWKTEIKTKGQIVSSGTNGSSGGTTTAGTVAASGAAGHIHAAAQMIADFMPADHGEMREFALSLDAMFGELAQAVETFQENRVREQFHPATVRPLDIAQSALHDGRNGWTHMILAIERHYRPQFEAAQQNGPVPGQKQTSGYFSAANSG